MKILKLFLVFIFLGFSSTSFASSYLRPRAGIFVPIDGADISYGLGGALGYEFFSMFSAEIAYQHFFGTGSSNDGDLISGEGIFHFPLPFVAPYASGGIGTLHASVPGEDHWDTVILLGGGIDFTFIPLVSVGIGFSYGIVKDRGDYIEPVATVGLKF